MRHTQTFPSKYNANCLGLTFKKCCYLKRFFSKVIHKLNDAVSIKVPKQGMCDNKKWKDLE